MFSEKPSYQVPVSSDTIDKMLDMLTKENQRLTEENQQLKQMMTKDQEKPLTRAELEENVINYMR